MDREEDEVTKSEGQLGSKLYPKGQKNADFHPECSINPSGGSDEKKSDII